MATEALYYANIAPAATVEAPCSVRGQDFNDQVGILRGLRRSFRSQIVGLPSYERRKPGCGSERSPAPPPDKRNRRHRPPTREVDLRPSARAPHLRSSPEQWDAFPAG